MVFCTGCFVSRIVSNGDKDYKGKAQALADHKTLEKENLTRNNFFIRKAEINIVSQEGKKNGLASIKFEKPDKFLISVKTKAGIEAVRVLITDDTILINDRLNRKLFYGSGGYLRKKYGVSAAVLPVILGDYLNEDLKDSIKSDCQDLKRIIKGSIKNLRINYIIDCKYGKSILTVPVNDLSESGLKIRFGNFLKRGETVYPGRIEIFNDQNKAGIRLMIRNIESPWLGKIEFIPGSRYEKIFLK